VSTDTGAFDRSTLDQKDRSELQTIAEAMGGKPGSRLRKAEIVDMILSLAGVNDSGDADGKNGSASGSDADDETKTADASDDGDGDGEDKAADSKEAGASDGSDDDADNKSKKAAKSNKDGKAKKDSKDSKDSKDNKDSKEDSNDGGASDDGDQSDNGQRGSGKGDSGRNQSERVDDGGSEPANRRRRRRGRDRNRDEGQPEWDGKTTPVEGALDLRDEGFGFLRIDGAMPSVEDIYVPIKLVRQHGLRRGDQIAGGTRPANRNEKNSALVEIATINGDAPEKSVDRPHFDDLDSVYPTERLTLESSDSSALAARAIDLLAPIGRGQRALVTGHPKAGAAAVLKDIAKAIQSNHPDVALMVLLVDEQPEVIADLRNSLDGVEIASSTFDATGEEHIAVAELAVERAKRMVEGGRDVFILLSGLSRLARSYNLIATGSGRTLAGGLDAGAIFETKAFFGAARNVDGDGSLTMVATASADTGSAIDEAILDELLPTSTMQLRLDVHAASRRIYPPIAIAQTGTDHEAALLGDDLEAVHALREAAANLAAGDPIAGNSAAIGATIAALADASDNGKFLKAVVKNGLGN